MLQELMKTKYEDGYLILSPGVYREVLFIAERPRWERAVNRAWFQLKGKPRLTPYTLWFRGRWKVLTLHWRWTNWRLYRQLYS